MSVVEDWFWGWARRHVARSGRGDFPVVASEDGREFWLDYRRAFTRNGVREAEADEASSRVLERDLFPGQHKQALLECVREIRDVEAADQPVPNQIAAARIAAANCPHCGGNGWATYLGAEIWGEAEGDRRAGLRFSLWCVCPLGRFMKQANDEADRESKVEVRSLADHRHLMITSAVKAAAHKECEADHELA